MRADSDLVAFQWAVSPGTYRFVDARYRVHRGEDPGYAAQQGKRPKVRRYLETHPFTCLAARLREGEWMIGGRTWGLDSHPGRTTRPLENEKALFLRFADLVPEEGPILEFAKKYGHLGIDHPINLAEGGPWPTPTGEALDDWRREIACMRDAVTVWRMFNQQDKAWLKAHFLWVEAPQARIALKIMKQDRSAFPSKADQEWAKMKDLWYDSHPGLEPSTGPPGSFRFRRRVWWRYAVPEVKALIPRGDLLRPAQLYVQAVINDQLQKHVRPQLLWDQPTAAAPEIRLRPLSLLGAMWLQFARAVEGGFEYVRCERASCRRWVRVEPQGRGRKRWCSPSCQVMASRARSKAKASPAGSGTRPLRSGSGPTRKP